MNPPPIEHRCLQYITTTTDSNVGLSFSSMAAYPQKWIPNQFNYRNLQLEHELEYNNLSVLGTDGQQQLQPQQEQLNYTARNNYQYSQPQITQSPSPPQSSLHGAFTMNQQSSQYGSNIQNPLNSNYVPGSYSNQQTPQPATHVPPSIPYRPTFTFSSRPTSSTLNLDSASASSNFLTPTGSTLPETFGQQRQSYYHPPPNGRENTSQNKRARSEVYNDEPNLDDPDQDSEMSPSEQKESTNRSKL